MSHYVKKRGFPSLLSLSIDHIINNLAKLNVDDLFILGDLPEHIKSRMVHLFTVTPYFWSKVDFKTVLALLLHENLEHLNLTACTLDDEILKMVCRCKNLRELHLTRVGKHNITTNGLLNMFPHLSRLYLLRMSECEAVTDKVIETLGSHCSNIGGLDIGGCQNVTDKSLIALSSLSRLQWLTCSHTQISDDGVEHLVSGPSGENMKELRIAECPNISERILKSVAINCPNMQVLVFHNCKKVQGKPARNPLISKTQLSEPEENLTLKYDEYLINLQIKLASHSKKGV